MKVEIIAVGSELLTPFRLDTNSLFLTAELNQAGLRVVHKSVVGDRPDEMLSSFAHALERADVIVSSGGAGPTATARPPSPGRPFLVKTFPGTINFGGPSRRDFAGLVAPCRRSTSGKPW